LFAPLIAELNELALTGIEVSVDGNVRQVYAGLATFSADNLTAHTIAGFQRHFSSGRICRNVLVICRRRILLKDQISTSVSP